MQRIHRFYTDFYHERIRMFLPSIESFDRYYYLFHESVKRGNSETRDISTGLKFRALVTLAIFIRDPGAITRHQMANL